MRDSFKHSSSLVLLPVPNFVPYGAALMTSPVGVARDDRCQGAELLRSAFRTLRRLQGAVILAGSGRFPPAFESHDCNSRPPMISATTASGRFIDTNRIRNTIQSPKRSKEKRQVVASTLPTALVRADRAIRTQKSETPTKINCTSSHPITQAKHRDHLAWFTLALHVPAGRRRASRRQHHFPYVPLAVSVAVKRDGGAVRRPGELLC